MNIILVTGSAGLVGSGSMRFFCGRGFTVVGIDNDMRRIFFGDDASTAWDQLKQIYIETNRIGDHLWWISDTKKFRRHYPVWDLSYGIMEIREEIFHQNTGRWV